jgi:hypothetical protein
MHHAKLMLDDAGNLKPAGIRADIDRRYERTASVCHMLSIAYNRIRPACHRLSSQSQRFDLYISHPLLCFLPFIIKIG